MDIIDIILARAGASGGGGGGGDTSNAVTDVTVENADTSAAKIKKAKVRKNAITKAYEVMKNYTSKGKNEDGSMTQKAITAELDLLNTRIDNIVVGEINLGPENAGKLVLVGDDGGLVPGTLTEEDIKGGVVPPPPPPVVPEKIVGLEIDYTNSVFTRLEDSEYLNPGAQFDQFKMYGGRMRCNVADDGTINAFYGDANYAEDGSNGQVMIYQPRFYYKREVLEFKKDNPTAISKERLYLSYGEQDDYKVHPLFINDSNDILDYVLLPAYEGSAYDVSASSYIVDDSADVDFATDKLSSIGGVKPISGVGKGFTAITAEQMAQNRGPGWHITNMRMESANQMLMITEYGQMNMQLALDYGAVTLADLKNHNCALLTGSTADLGNASGTATESIQTRGENSYTVTQAKQCAISYRGMENLWGNTWRMVGGVLIYGDGEQRHGMPYIAADYNYSSDSIDNYISSDFTLSANSSGVWIGNMGYSNADLDWVYFPVCGDGKSAVPVGDRLYTIGKTLRGILGLVVGGQWLQDLQAGPFDYACDSSYANATRSNNACIMFIPVVNNIYNANISKWQAKMGV